MVLKKIPSFQEVKDWANGKFTTLSEVNASGDVPNSAYSDDAGALGGSPPSVYETPTSTQYEQVEGGFTPHDATASGSATVPDYNTSFSDGGSYTSQPGNQFDGVEIRLYIDASACQFCDITASASFNGNEIESQRIQTPQTTDVARQVTHARTDDITNFSWDINGSARSPGGNATINYAVDIQMVNVPPVANHAHGI